MAKNEIAEQKRQGIAGYLSSDLVKNNIVSVIGEKDAQPFISSVVSAVQANPDLAKCTNQSIFSAALLGYSLKLPQSPQLGFFYMVPYKNNDKSKSGAEVYEAQFQISYKGLYQLAMRSGQYKKIVVTEIREGELVYYNPITEDIEFKPELDYSKRQTLNIIGYYAAYEMINGAIKFIYWDKNQMEKHAETYSASYRSDIKWKSKKSFWSKEPIIMAKKTMLKQLLTKWGILSVELRNVLESDQAVIGEDGSKTYIDNQPDEPAPAIDVESDVVETIEGEVIEN
jgi:recombination protein RecT